MALLKKAGIWGLRFQIEHKRGFYRTLSASTFLLGVWILGVRQECLQDEHIRKTQVLHSRASWWITFHMHCRHLPPQVLSMSCVTPQRETALKLTASFHQI